VILRAWKNWVKSGNDNTAYMGAEVLKTTIHGTFWEKVKNMSSTGKPIFLTIKVCRGRAEKERYL